ncbi:MAG TPA: hypothetical protein PJ994_03010 [Tepidiformaceae bacterium]|nr:hypothetical protein [Tepidiformaceae bacterium]
MSAEGLHRSSASSPETTNWASLVRELCELNAFFPAYGIELVVADPERVVLATSGQTELCRQNTGQWVGEVLEVLASLTAGFLPTRSGDEPGTFVAPYGATVRSTYHLRPSNSARIEAEARWVRRGRAQAVIETVVRDAEGRELVRVISQHAAVPEPLTYSIAALREAQPTKES